LPSPKHSKETTKTLKENLPTSDYREPYQVSLHASLEDGFLPVLNSHVRLEEIGNNQEREILRNIDMIWDSGVHQTVITEELLSESFRQHLQSPENDCTALKMVRFPDRGSCWVFQYPSPNICNCLGQTPTPDA
jgi:hypothetical protein